MLLLSEMAKYDGQHNKKHNSRYKNKRSHHTLQSTRFVNSFSPFHYPTLNLTRNHIKMKNRSFPLVRMTKKHSFIFFQSQSKYTMRFNCSLYCHTSQGVSCLGTDSQTPFNLDFKTFLGSVNYPKPESNPQREISTVGNLH